MEADEKIEMILAWADSREWFNTDFVMSLKESLDRWGRLTERQENALDNLIEKLKISPKKNNYKKDDTKYIIIEKKADSMDVYWAILGIKPTTDVSEIKKAFRDLVVILHPDKHGGNNIKAKEKFQQLQDAYEKVISKIV